MSDQENDLSFDDSLNQNDSTENDLDSAGNSSCTADDSINQSVDISDPNETNSESVGESEYESCNDHPNELINDEAEEHIDYSRPTKRSSEEHEIIDLSSDDGESLASHSSSSDDSIRISDNSCNVSPEIVITTRNGSKRLKKSSPETTSKVKNLLSSNFSGWRSSPKFKAPPQNSASPDFEIVDEKIKPMDHSSVDSHIDIVRNGNISQNRRVIQPQISSHAIPAQNYIQGANAQNHNNRAYGKRRNLAEILQLCDLSFPTIKAQKAEETRLRHLKKRSEALRKNLREFNANSNVKIDDNDDEENLFGESFFDPSNCGVHTDDRFNKPDKHGRVLINVNRPIDEKPIFLRSHLSKIIKPHQIGGLRFLYDNVIDNLAGFSKSPGFGCILAHNMGLGKTLQIVSFVDIFLTHTPAETVLVVVPVNTLKNWLHEFEMWLPTTKHFELKENVEVKPRKFKIYSINETTKDITSRAKEILNWQKTGGVLVIGYEMYRILTFEEDEESKKTRKQPKGLTKQKLDQIRDALVNPGPDLVVCDEGHKIKNHKAATSIALKKIATRRRIVLTGYPLQNNLFEYWCMVDFVRPNFLGTHYEFQNQFEAPITNGQCTDSTNEDVRIMKEQAHVLHKLLRGFVQRRSHNILKQTLPSKFEHVILVKMSEVQRDLMLAFLEKLRDDVVRKHIHHNQRLNPIIVFAVFCKVWNHPDIVWRVAKEDGMIDDTDLDFANETASGDVSVYDEPSSSVVASRQKRLMDYGWAKRSLALYKPGLVENGPKFVIFFEILEKTILAGDKLLVFSHSLFTLDLLEKFLASRDVPSSRPTQRKAKWSKFINYFRLDGSTSAKERENFINQFNKSKEFKLFLLSTKAGSLGINLVGANRIVIFDASWNPCHDAQAACRVFRYGQQKQCYIYRLVCDDSLEKKIYDRQINKQAVSNRVVDELNPDNHLTRNDIEQLMHNLDHIDLCPAQNFTEQQLESLSDELVRNICRKFYQHITNLPFEHESLLLDRDETRLSARQKKVAEAKYIEARKRTKDNLNASIAANLRMPDISEFPIFASNYSEYNSDSDIDFY